MQPRIGIAIGSLALMVAACGEVNQPSAAVAERPLNTADPVTPGRLLASYQVGGTASSGLEGTAPVGAVMCLVHEATLGELLNGFPFPDAIQSSAVIGCDRLITSPGRIVYDAANSPDFTEFTSRFTNGASETVQSFLATTDGNLLRVGIAGASGQDECWIVQGLKGLPSPAHAERGCNPNRPQDLAAFGVDSIGLNVESLQFTFLPFPDGTPAVQVNFNMTWEFFGHRSIIP